MRKYLENTINKENKESSIREEKNVNYSKPSRNITLLSNKQPISFLRRLANSHIWLLTNMRGTYIGTDRFGNDYYQERKPRANRRQRRWVRYNGHPEATKIPPEWFGWLHYTSDHILPETTQHPWQKEHQPNRSGTIETYRPPGHPFKTGQRSPTHGDYEPWIPQ